MFGFVGVDIWKMDVTKHASQMLDMLKAAPCTPLDVWPPVCGCVCGCGCGCVCVCVCLSVCV
jgi:hypothetical protein